MRWIGTILLLWVTLIEGQSGGWRNVKFNWTNPTSWTWIYYGTKLPLPARVTSQPDQLLLYYDPNNQYSNPGFGGPIYTTQSFGPGKVAFYVEWIGNSQSATVFELLSQELMTQGQFASNNCWPNCGELDIYEMLLQSNAQSKNYGAPSNFGAFTLHKGDRAQACSCPAAGGNENWYQNTAPMTSACSAEFQNHANIKNSIVTIIDQDTIGQYIQLIQYPVITENSDGTTSLSIGANSVATMKIYNNATTFYGNDPNTCTQGSPNPATGWPWFNQPMQLIAWEQDYTSESGIAGDTLGQFQLTNVQIWVGGAGNSASSSSPLSITFSLVILLVLICWLI